MSDQETTFSSWYNENRENETLVDMYREYVHEQKQCCFKPETFRKWMKNHFESELFIR